MFLASQKLLELPVKPDKTLKEKIVKVDLLRQFSTYLFEQKDVHGEPYKYGTALQYLSGVKNLLERHFGRGCFEECDQIGIQAFIGKKTHFQNDDWYGKLRGKVQKAFVGRCIIEGATITLEMTFTWTYLGIEGFKKAQAFNPREQKIVARWHFSKEMYEEHCYLVITFQTVGRTTEFSKSLYPHYTWDSYQRSPTRLIWKISSGSSASSTTSTGSNTIIM